MDLENRFTEHREHLRRVAHRVLGSHAEAEDAVQEAWLRVQAAPDDAPIENPRAWLTTVVSRVALNQLRSRTARREEFPERLPDPVVSRDGPDDPQSSAETADAVGLALLVVLDALAPEERLAFVLHDMFGWPFDEIAPLVERTPAATRQLASRARRRVRGATPDSRSRSERREVADAFLAAARRGDIAGLVAVLSPDVVLRVDTGSGVGEVHGAEQVAGQAAAYRGDGQVQHAVLVDGRPGALATVDGRPVALLAFTVEAGRITGIEILADPPRLASIDPAVHR
jgi:RNA polymerase sigma factor (sigma-70 family)